MRLLITGGTGFIGQHLITKLLVEGNVNVTLLLREQYSQLTTHPLPEPLQKTRPHFGVVYADLRNYRQTARAIREAAPEAVLHLAAAGVSDPFLGVETAVRHNLNGTLNLLRACFESNHTVKKLVMSRTPGELTHLNVYATSKLAAWSFCQMYVHTHRWPIVGAMIYQAFGPGQSSRSLIPSAIEAALAGDDFPMTEGKQAKDWIYISDVVDGLLATLRSELPLGSSVDLGSGKATAVAEVVQTIYRLAESEGKPLIGALPTRPGEVEEQKADVTLTRELIGWETAVSLENGLHNSIEKAKRVRNLLL